MNESTRQLLQSAHSGDVKKLERLLKQGYSPNIRDDKQRTLLCWASLQGHVAIVRMLLSYGANPEIVGQDGWTALKLAEHKGHAGVAHLLRNYQSGEISIFSPEVKHLLSDRVALINMMIGAEDEDFLIIQCLLEKGVSPDLDNGHGVTALAFACIRDNPAVVETLLKRGANPNIGNTSFIPLHLAASRGYTHIVDLLLTYKADINAETDEGWNVLFAAVMNHHVDIVKILLKYGAHPTRKNARGYSAMSWAKHLKFNDIVKLLTDAETAMNRPSIVNLNAELVKAVFAEDVFLVEKLIKDGADPNKLDEKGNSLLYNALYEGKTKVINTLVKYHADINFMNFRGDTALRAALSMASLAFSDRNTVVEVFTKQGIDPNVLTRDYTESVTIQVCPKLGRV
jgi:ankyrin repeat protein